MKLTAVEPTSIVVGDAGNKPVALCEFRRYRHWRIECKVCGFMADGELSPEAAIARVLQHLARRHG